MSNSLVYLTPPNKEFEAAYISARKSEGRLYPDDLVRALPRMPAAHPQAKEWQLRQHNVQQLLRYLSERAVKSVLDLGCGNGWLTHQLLGAGNCELALGLDVNATELEQGLSLFGNENCQFAYGDIFKAQLEQAPFDAIILASCAQYFPDLSALLQRLLELLTPAGEIHLLDTPIYDTEKVEEARLRTRRYYQSAENRGMQSFYHHHDWESLTGINFQLKYDPSTLLHRIRRKLGQSLSPFPWLIIRHPLPDAKAKD